MDRQGMIEEFLLMASSDVTVQQEVTKSVPFEDENLFYMCQLLMEI